MIPFGTLFNVVTVLMSACIPAPPDESEPAIISILEFGFKLFNIFGYNLYALINKFFIFTFTHHSNF